MVASDDEYDDFINRFEEWVELGEAEFDNEDELYDVLHDWLGIKKSGDWLPSQNQMDVFTRHFGFDEYSVMSRIDKEANIEAATPTWEFKNGSMYNEGTKEFAKRIDQHTYEHYNTFEQTRHFTYGDRIVIVDEKTGKVLAHKYDLKNKKDLGSRI